MIQTIRRNFINLTLFFKISIHFFLILDEPMSKFFNAVSSNKTTIRLIIENRNDK